MLKKLQEKAGFVSIETVVVTGVVIALAVYALVEYNSVGKMAITEGIDKLSSTLTSLDIPLD